MILVKLTALVSIGWLALVGTAQAAGDVAAGQAKSAACGTCHGDKGQGSPPFPALAGKSEADQVKALKEFKSGARNNPMMTGIAAGLSDQDMEDLAAYYASLK
jgi:cytochrome c553